MLLRFCNRPDIISKCRSDLLFKTATPSQSFDSNFNGHTLVSYDRVQCTCAYIFFFIYIM